LTPGPALFQKNPEFVWGVIASMFIGNVILLVFNLPMANYWAKIILVPYKLLYPLILIVTMIGAFSISNSFWNVGVMLIFGVIGYILKKLEFPLAAITLSFVLGTQIELTLLQSLSASDKGMLIFFTRPISGTIMALCIGILLFSIISRMRKAKYIIESEDD
jgi:putative tricarboxylic transport membrane protein